MSTLEHFMRFVRILIIGGLCLGGVPAGTLAQSRAAVEIRSTTGPLEQQAKPLTAGTALPRRKSAQPADYPWELRRIGAKAALIVQVTLDKSGRVAEVRRAQGPLLQPAIGSLSDAAAERVAADAVMRSVAAALNKWRFDDPAGGPITFQLSFGFVGGQSTHALTDPSEVLPAQVAAAPWAAAEGTMPTGKAIQPPKKTRYVKPVYPKAALDARVQGEVLLEIVIGTDGRVDDARILKSVPQLDQAAIEATLAARYEPVEINGIPVRVTSLVTHTFSFRTKPE
jgi:TonB family protein